MNAFRIYVAILFTILFAYTLLTVGQHGWNFVPIFVQDIAAINWSGQFNLDFALLLCLSSLWLAWRNDFTLKGIAIGLVGLIGGLLFLAAYLFIISFQVNNDIRVLLLGENRAKRLLQ